MEPKRIVSLAPSITETLYMLGVWDRVVGVSFFCNKPPEARQKPRVGAYLNVNYRLLEQLNPDLVLTTTGAQLKVSRELAEKGYTVYPIPLPLTVYGIAENIIAIGSLVNRIPEARKLAYTVIEKFLGMAEDEPFARIYYEVDLGEPYTVGALTYIDHGLRHVGLENVFGKVRTTYFKPDFEEVAKEGPDIIIYEPKPFTNPSLDKVIRMFEKRGWGRLRAIRERRILLLEPDSLAHYGPSHVDALAKVKREARRVMGLER